MIEKMENKLVCFDKEDLKMEVEKNIKQIEYLISLSKDVEFDKKKRLFIFSSLEIFSAQATDLARLCCCHMMREEGLRIYNIAFDALDASTLLMEEINKSYCENTVVQIPENPLN